MVTVPPQLSPVEVALPVLLGSVESPQASTLSVGQLMFGAVVSAKLMCCTQLLVLWQESGGYRDWSSAVLSSELAGVGASVYAMVTVPPQLSPVEVALPVLLGSVESPQAS